MDPDVPEVGFVLGHDELVHGMLLCLGRMERDLLFRRVKTTWAGWRMRRMPYVDVGPRFVRLEADGIRYRDREAEMVLHYGAIIAVYEDDQIIVLTRTPRRPWAFIPKRVFATPLAEAEFKAALQSHLPF